MIVAAILYTWLQYAADGMPHARAVVTGACPTAYVDGRPSRMQQRASETSGFSDAVCDARVPADAKHVRVADRTLPAPVSREPRTIVVFGDSGCRVLGTALQACNDPVGWPFPSVARSIAKVHPDLIVDVGDYYYRETPCPPLYAGCAGTPFGDNAQSWYADWFTPGIPFFSVAPLVLARGNHEDCRRGGNGWGRYLDAYPFGPCVATSAPFAVTVPGLRIVVFDSAVANDERVDPKNAAPFRADFHEAHEMVHGQTWFLTHRPPYFNADEMATMGNELESFAAILAGHIHLFAVMNDRPNPPLIINGIGGDTLDTGTAQKFKTTLGADASSVSANFGYVLYTRTQGGWTISVRNPDGSEREGCTLTLGKPGAVGCKPLSSR